MQGIPDVRSGDVDAEVSWPGTRASDAEDLRFVAGPMVRRSHRLSVSIADQSATVDQIRRLRSERKTDGR